MIYGTPNTCMRFNCAEICRSNCVSLDIKVFILQQKKNQISQPPNVDLIVSI